MKKTVIALALLGSATGAAYAQSNVTIYGVIDTGYIKQTGTDTKMDANKDSKIGFRGVEDLGGGQKATFQLEKRFKVHNGTNDSSSDKDWEGAANVGLKGDNWGAIRLGRMNGIATEHIRKFDPFDQNGIGRMWNSTQRGVRNDNMLRFDSLDYAGFSFNAAYQLGRNMNDKTRDTGNVYVSAKKGATGAEAPYNHSAGYDNDGYQLGINYKNGGFAATANYQMLADSNRSTLWNVGVSYSWDTVKLEALYQYTKDKAGIKDNNSAKSNWTVGNSLKEQQALIGVEWKVGPGRLDASAQWLKVEGDHVDTYDKKDTLDDSAWRVAVGYTYNLSKRTSLYGIVSYSDYDDEQIGKIFDGTAQDSMTGVQLGITHKF